MESRVKSSFSFRLLIVALLVALHIPLACVAQEVLTNDAVISLVKAHLSTSAIVNQIRKSPGNYVLTSKVLISLKQQGVPDAVIEAMQAKDASTTASPQSGSESRHPADDSNNAPGDGVHWQVSPTRDELRNTVTNHPAISIRGLDSGTFRLTASCRQDDLMGVKYRYAALEIESQTQAIGFQRVQSSQTIVSHENLGGDVEATVPAATVCTWIDSSLDAEEPRTVPSIECKSDRRAAIELSGDLTGAGRAILNKTLPGGSPIGDFANSMVAALAAPKIAQIQAQTIRIQDLLRASQLRLRFNLTNGETTVIKVPLEDRLKDYLENCTGASKSQPAPPNSSGLAGSPSAATHEPPRAPASGGRGDTVADTMSRPMTANELTSRLPSILSNAAVKYNHDPHVYDDEIPFISEAVHTCAQITAAKAAGVRTFVRSNFNYEDLDRLGSQYKICHGNGQYVPHPDGRKEAGLWLTIFVSGDDDSFGIQASRHWRDGQGFFVNLHESGRSDTFFEGLIKQESP
jgi:hypothetical protein